ncbi:MAG: CPA2 family monovalent cation:H+ antiporter-2, partial [Myxococcota bacterium]
MTPHDFLVNLALVLGVASIAAAACRVLRQPIIVGYLLAGVAVGPYTALPFFAADVAMVTTLSELGVILLMFCLGVDFSARRLVQVAG